MKGMKMPKWNDGEPTKPGTYLVQTKDGKTELLNWCGGWSCMIDPVTGETYKYYQRFDIEKWADVL